MQERIFTLKKGTEVADRFDGVTIPFQVPSTVEEMLAVGSPETVVAIFNQAHALNVQKHVKSFALEDDATVDSLRAEAAGHKYGQVRVRGTSTGGSKKIKPETLEAAVGQDFIASLTPEQRAKWQAQLDSLRVKPTTDAAPAADAKPANGKQAKTGK